MAGIKRFYKQATIAPGEGGFLLQLDGRSARTPKRHVLALPTESLGRLVAEEWALVEETIDPRQMPLTRLANVALDGIAARRQETIEAVLAYGGTDLLCYRSGQPAELKARQARLWDPVLLWARETQGLHFEVTESITPVVQPEETLVQLSRVLQAREAFQLTGLQAATGLLGSVLLALAFSEKQLTADEAFEAAFVDELYQAEVWGADEEAEARRAHLRAETGDLERWFQALKA